MSKATGKGNDGAGVPDETLAARLRDELTELKKELRQLDAAHA